MGQPATGGMGSGIMGSWRQVRPWALAWCSEALVHHLSMGIKITLPRNRPFIIASPWDASTNQAIMTTWEVPTWYRRRILMG